MKPVVPIQGRSPFRDSRHPAIQQPFYEEPPTDLVRPSKEENGRQTMDIKLVTRNAVAVLALGAMTMAPLSANAQRKDDWKNLAIAGGIVGLLGLVKHDSTLTFAGTAGALYSAWRYEEDRKSESKSRRARYELFNRGSFTRNGHRYTRKTVWKNGKKYYQFVRVR
jgi:hypothetical protein